ncbi:hypothetical protein CERZMDRAFT_89113 [Cercospora zeae-maydis SCOH1-5]|uniref:Uncharacterized protein n=1 Tax=Cercospora zeae-maydis SCOH1-5 TaxID=717836 RepID=A0A6A6EYA6_9PEZI|nr:hypothetical protein CERZMDRAFT_89113 [Cercospora zeae-maydis SCOH1-5]
MPPEPLRRLEAFDDPRHLQKPVKSASSLPSMKDGYTEFGSDFGRGTIKDASETLESLKKLKSAPVKDRRRAYVKEIYDIVTIPRSLTESKSTGTVMLCIRYHTDKGVNPLAKTQPLEEVRSRSDCIVILGKETVNTRETRLIREREQRIRYILACVHRGLNPDTGETANETAKAKMP